MVGFICFALAPQIALALGADGELEADCVRYSRILFLSSPAFVMQYLFQSFFIAAEKPALSLKVNVIAGLTNAVLDYVLIVVFLWDWWEQHWLPQRDSSSAESSL